MEERLQKYMARCGVASRRKCEEIILSGDVKVNDITITELGHKVNCELDRVSYKGNPISLEEKKVYIMLNKPKGYISSVKDENDRKTVLDIVKVQERVYPIGRLDYDTSGLLLLTNDGDVCNNIIHPSHEVDKVYEATLRGIPTIEDIEDFCNGLDLGGYITSNAKFDILITNYNTSSVEISIHEGKNRQVRRMCAAIGHPVKELNRKSIGIITLKDLQVGMWRYLTLEEISYIKSL